MGAASDIGWVNSLIITWCKIVVSQFRSSSWTLPLLNCSHWGWLGNSDNLTICYAFSLWKISPDSLGLTSVHSHVIGLSSKCILTSSLSSSLVHNTTIVHGDVSKFPSSRAGSCAWHFTFPKSSSFLVRIDAPNFSSKLASISDPPRLKALWQSFWTRWLGIWGWNRNLCGRLGAPKYHCWLYVCERNFIFFACWRIKFLTGHYSCQIRTLCKKSHGGRLIITWTVWKVAKPLPNLIIYAYPKVIKPQLVEMRETDFFYPMRHHHSEVIDSFPWADFSLLPSACASHVVG